MHQGSETSLFAPMKLTSLFALIDAKLTTTGKEIFTMERNEKDPNLSKIDFFFLSFLWKPGHWTKRWRKESWCVFYYYSNCDSCRPVLNTKYQRIAETWSKHSRTSTMKLSCEKAPSLKFDWAINISLNWFLMTKLFYKI